MTTQEQNGFLTLEHLSDIELYYCSSEFFEDEKIFLEGEEFHHAVNVMRNSVDEILHITDGRGKLFRSKIVEITKSKLIATVLEKFDFVNAAENIWFCLPLLKNTDRLKFAVEKCVELGITNFVLFSSRHSISKKINLQKIHKTALAAMKQSLRTILPKITSASFIEIINSPGNKILFDQSSQNRFDGRINTDEPIYFLFGPEGGFEESELSFIPQEKRFSLSTNRLRSETAIMKCVSLLTLP